MISFDKDFLRYDRQISIKGFDIEGQTRLKRSSTLVIGLGGLGCSAYQYLGLAGIGKLILVDFDIVIESNLNRQVLPSQQRLKTPNVDSAALSLKSINPDIELVTVIGSLLSDEALAKQTTIHDMVLDCCDDLLTKQQLNKICFKQKNHLCLPQQFACQDC